MKNLLESQKVTMLITECDNIRRREASDIEDDDFENIEIPYIDTNSYVDKLNSDNNTLIFGRRGCGKTSLLISVAQKNKKSDNSKIIVVKDMQSMKNMDSDLIVCRLLQKIFLEMKNYVNFEIVPNVLENYKNHFKGAKGILKFILRKRNLEYKNQYEKLEEYIYLSEKMIRNIAKIQELERNIQYTIVKNHEESIEQKEIFECKFGGKLLNKENIGFTLLNEIGKSETDFELGIEFSNAIERQKNVSNTTSVNCENVITKERAFILEGQKENIVALLKCFYAITKKKIVLMLDDFYQVKNSNQPYIIQYFHDISKECTNKGFRFKLFAIPGRLVLNKTGADMSYKDDFSPITIDTDISNIDFLRKHLSDMLSVISKSIDKSNYLSQQDIMSLFAGTNNDEVFTYLILASGAVPRDFIVLFREVVLEARKNNQNVIKKENIYDVVKQTRQDKDNNVENDASLSSEIIDILRRSLENDFAGKYKTNIFLYPINEANDSIQETILRNLENLRYIYLIKDNLTSERTKVQCKAYMIDMSFCIVGSRKKNNFEIRKYWEKTEKSSVLRQSEVWSFPKAIIDEVRNEMGKDENKEL